MTTIIQTLVPDRIKAHMDSLVLQHWWLEDMPALQSYRIGWVCRCGQEMSVKVSKFYPHLPETGWCKHCQRVFAKDFVRQGRTNLWRFE